MLHDLQQVGASAVCNDEADSSVHVRLNQPSKVLHVLRMPLAVKHLDVLLSSHRYALKVDLGICLRTRRTKRTKRKKKEWGKRAFHVTNTNVVICDKMPADIYYLLYTLCVLTICVQNKRIQTV